MKDLPVDRSALVTNAMDVVGARNDRQGKDWLQQQRHTEETEGREGEGTESRKEKAKEKGKAEGKSKAQGKGKAQRGGDIEKEEEEGIGGGRDGGKNADEGEGGEGERMREAGGLQGGREAGVSPGVKTAPAERTFGSWRFGKKGRVDDQNSPTVVFVFKLDPVRLVLFFLLMLTKIVSIFAFLRVHNTLCRLSHAHTYMHTSMDVFCFTKLNLVSCYRTSFFCASVLHLFCICCAHQAAIAQGEMITHAATRGDPKCLWTVKTPTVALVWAGMRPLTTCPFANCVRRSRLQSSVGTATTYMRCVARAM